MAERRSHTKENKYIVRKEEKESTGVSRDPRLTQRFSTGKDYTTIPVAESTDPRKGRLVVGENLYFETTGTTSLIADIFCMINKDEQTM